MRIAGAGEYIRSSAVVGSVVAADAMMSGGDGQPETLAGVTVTLDGEHAMGETRETGMDGGFAFTGLRSGTYTVTISDFPEDVSFETVSVEVEVDVGEVGQADFTGHYIRTSAVEGQVIIEGEGLQGVTVTLSGGPAEENFTMMTDSDGMYRFEDLRPGDYTVSISDFDTRDYEFASTSQDVSVDLDETGTVSFTGVLLRTSGISGRVSVDGEGLENIAVTLSGAADASTMTDVSGQYAFAGLAAGDYTVTIAVDDPGYVFDEMSKDVTVADDMSEIVSFDGQHARTASVSGMLFLDEASKNDMYDEGEDAFPAPGVPVVLVGPGVSEQNTTATGPDGSFEFPNLIKGEYQLVVQINAELQVALGDFAYGGPLTGYPIELGVGDAATQNIPFDITHQTVNFSVTLKSGENPPGDPLPGAMVSLYGDVNGETPVASGTTGEDGMAAIRFARTGGTTVYASVSADDPYDAEDKMQVVTWNPRSPTHDAMNENDIVNLMVDVSFSGATITTEAGGGDPLDGWKLTAMVGEEAEEDAPDELDEDGMAMFQKMVDAVPVTYAFSVAEGQSSEEYTPAGIEWTHDGLSVAGTQDAGVIEVRFTTQTLKVYVHHDRDQVPGYTGNVLGGDRRDTGRMVTVELRNRDRSGPARTFRNGEWNAQENTNFSRGVWTFTRVPADANVIVRAVVGDATKAMVVYPQELAAYTDPETNGIEDGRFGEMGGFSEEVKLCPLQAVDPTNQRQGECSSFAYVDVYPVKGNVWKRALKVSDKSLNDDRFDSTAVAVDGITVGLVPVEGENLAGDVESSTTEKKARITTDEQGFSPVKGTEVLDERWEFDFGVIASGVYTPQIEPGWRWTRGSGESISSALDFGPTNIRGTEPFDAETSLGTAFNPLGGAVDITVTPKTAIAFGYVRDPNEFPVEGVTVTANGVEAVTDVHGRYIARDVPAETRVISGVTYSNHIFVETDHSGSGKTHNRFAFAANRLHRQDVKLDGAGDIATIRGRVTESGSGDAVAGVRIWVDYRDGDGKVNPENSNASGGRYLTGADGTYSVNVVAQDLGQSVFVSASKDRMNFAPPELAAPAHSGSDVSGYNFVGFHHATIYGRVEDTDGTALSGVAITATNVVANMPGDTITNTTDARGTFRLSVPFGTYDIKAELDGYEFDYPTAGTRRSVAPDQMLNFGTITAKLPAAAARNVTATRQRIEDDATAASTAGVDESDPTAWQATILVTYTAGDLTAVPDGYTPPTAYTIQTNTGAAGAWEAPTATPVTVDGTAVPGRFTIESAAGNDGEFMVRVIATAAHGTTPGEAATPDIVYESNTPTVTAVDPSASGVSARRQESATSNVADPAGAYIQASWSAVTNERSTFRVVAKVNSDAGGEVWVVLATGAAPTVTGSSRTYNAGDARSAGLAVAATQDLPLAAAFGTGASVTITAAELEAAIEVAVESVQGTASATNRWERSTAVPVAAKTGS